MAKFCNQCGRPLKEGELCGCTQKPLKEPADMEYQANPQQTEQPGKPAYIQQSAQIAGKVKVQAANVFSRIMPLFKHPVTEIKALAEMNDFSAVLPLTVFHIAVVFLLSAIQALIFKAEIGSLGSYINIPYVRAVIFITLAVGIADFALPGILLFTTNFIFKGNTTYARMLSLTGGKNLIYSCFLTAGMVLLQLNTGIGLFIISLGLLFAFIILVSGYYKIVPLSEDSKVYSLFLTYVIASMISGISFYILYKSIINDLVRSIGYFF